MQRVFDRIRPYAAGIAVIFGLAHFICLAVVPETLANWYEATGVADEIERPRVTLSVVGGILLIVGAVLSYPLRIYEPGARRREGTAVSWTRHVYWYAVGAMVLIAFGRFADVSLAGARVFVKEGLAEGCTAVLAAAAGATGLYVALGRRGRGRGLAAVMAAGALFFAAEELSYGQHYLGFATPTVLEGNIQGEANLHNYFNPVFTPLAYGIWVALLAAAVFYPSLRELARLDPTGVLRDATDILLRPMDIPPVVLLSAGIPIGLLAGLNTEFTEEMIAVLLVCAGLRLLDYTQDASPRVARAARVERGRGARRRRRREAVREA